MQHQQQDQLRSPWMHDPSQRAKHNPATKNCNSNTKQAASRQDFRTDFQRFHGHQTLNHPRRQMNESLWNPKSAVSSMNESLSLFCGIQLLYIRKHLQHFFWFVLLIYFPPILWYSHTGDYKRKLDKFGYRSQRKVGKFAIFGWPAGTYYINMAVSPKFKIFKIIFLKKT